jgi:hypothetical protein
MKGLKDIELMKYKSEVEAKFDNKKNWSIMIDNKDNNVRN